IFTTIVILMIIGLALQEKYFKAKMKKIKPYGKIIDVFDGKIHISKVGNGEKTIVLLPGLGVALPSADFGPIMRSLSKRNYTVVCIEYYGVGFSSQTDRSRTCENYVEEIRSLLLKDGIKGPYILMPHSISSVYSEYYASKYPEEVEAIISLDGTSTAYIGEDMPRFIKPLLKIGKFQQKIGLTSILARVTTNKKGLEYIGYNEKEIDDMISFGGFAINNTLLNQMISSIECVKDTNRLPYPEDVPYFKIISKQTYETKNNQIKISPQEYQHEHLMRIGDKAKYEILEGNHFIYHNNHEIIAELTDKFLKEINN
ncbi:alpha/beta fold hydrolase, partial [Clostridium sp.]|uniref:alpha/beta fold hydrolase n=1 Tax=Clostridium sp. TaxID=1506 RepID=UPI003F2D5F3A